MNRLTMQNLVVIQTEDKLLKQKLKKSVSDLQSRLDYAKKLASYDSESKLISSRAVDTFAEIKKRFKAALFDPCTDSIKEELEKFRKKFDLKRWHRKVVQLLERDFLNFAKDIENQRVDDSLHQAVSNIYDISIFHILLTLIRKTRKSAKFNPFFISPFRWCGIRIRGI